jgi:OTU domain-containing protein 6
MFKRKSKKSATDPLPPRTVDDNLEDDLFAQLDAQEQPALTVPAIGATQSATTLATTTSAESSQSTKLQKPKKDSKLRFKAREVNASFYLWQFTKIHISWGNMLQARKVLKMNALSKPSDPSADAKLEQEARNEERDIKRICDQLGLDMFEVCNRSNREGVCLNPYVRSNRTDIVFLQLWRTNWRSIDWLHERQPLMP